jgi:hypothetical protein
VTRACAAAALAALAAAGAGGAMPAWTTPQVISGADADGLALVPELATNASGAAVAVWDRETGPDCVEAPASLTCIHTIETAYRPAAGAPWDSRHAINRPGVGARPRAGIDDAGDAVLIWVHDIGRDRVLQATYRRGPNGEFPNAEDLSKEVLAVDSHHVALDDAGDAVAVWAQRPTGLAEVRAELRRNGSWGVAELLSAGAVLGGPSLAVSGRGEAIVAWVEEGSVKAVRGDISAGTWEPATTLAPPEGFGDPVVAVNRAGDALAAWLWRSQPREVGRVQAAFRPAGGTWGPRTDVGGALEAAPARPRVALDDAGNGYVVWLGGAGASSVQSAVRARASGAWSSAASVSAAGAADPQLAVDPSGNAVAVWTDASGATTAAVRPAAAGAWQPPLVLSGGGTSDPRLAVDRVGNALATWDVRAGARADVQSADLSGGWELTLVNAQRPSVQGRPRVGGSLLCRRGTWQGTVPIRYAYAWLRNGRAVRGAGGARYVVRRADRGRRIACRVSATNAARSLSVTSAPVRVRK